MRSCCCGRLLTAWCIIVSISILTITQLFVYVTRSGYKLEELSSNGGYPRRRSELSLCPFSTSHHHKLSLITNPTFYRCKTPRKKGFSRLLDPKKFIFSRYLGEINGTAAQDSNKLNLIANAIDLKGYVIDDNPLLISNCFLSKDSGECTCTCIGETSNNCTGTHPLPTHLYGSPCYIKPGTPQVIDSEALQTVLCDNSLPRIMSVDSFLHNSYRDIVFVHPISTIRQEHELTPEESLIQSKLRLDSPILDCTQFGTIYNMSLDILHGINALAKDYCLEQFRMAGCHCIAAWYKNNDLGMYWFADEKVSVVFTSWTGMDRDDSDIFLPISEPADGGEGDKPAATSSAKSSDDSNQSHGIIRRRHHSSLAKMVLQQTKKFIKGMAQGHQYIVIHIRIDNSFSSYTQRKDFTFYYQSCLFKLKSNLDKLILEHPDALVFFFMDNALNVDGTNGDINSSANIQFTLVKTVLLGVKHEIQHYSAEKYGGRSDTPFITLVEQEFMCRASYLLTLGGGQIQDRLKKRFLKMHFRKKLLDFEYCDVDPLTSPKR